jgi:serine/threonine-protein kinase
MNRVLGTPAYTAPEVHRPGESGPAADQFAFCVTVWEALFGARPFTGASRAQIAEAIDAGIVRAPPSDRGVPRRVRRALERGLSARADARFPSIDALLDDLARAPRAKQRGIAVAAVVVLSGGGLALWARAGGDDPGDRCAASARRVAGVWDDDRRAAGRPAFLATGRPHAADTFTRTAEVLDQYAADWTAQRIEACRATHVEHAQSPPMLDLRNHCLDRRLTALGALVDVFAGGADPEVLDQATTASRKLGDLADCADVPALSGALPRPSEPDRLAEVERLETELAATQALFDAGKYKDGVTRAEALVGAARTAGFAPLEADSLALYASLRGAAGDHPGAKASAEEALQAAGLARNDRLTAAQLTFLIQIVGMRLGELGEAENLIPIAQAAVARAGARPRQVASLDSAIGQLRHRQSRYDEAIALLESALATFEQEPDDGSVTSTLNRLANVLVDKGDFAAGVAHLERAIALQQETLGPEHPYVAMMLNNLGRTFEKMGDYDRAIATYQRALDIKERVLGPMHPDLMPTLTNFGAVMNKVGRYPEARALLERALAIGEQTIGAKNAAMAAVLYNLGGVIRQLEGSAAAEPWLLRALELEEKELGPSHPEVARTLLELGSIRQAQGDLAGAEPYFLRARKIIDATVGPDHPNAAIVAGILGELRQAQGRLAEALVELRRSLAITEKTLGSDHTQAANIHQSLGHLLLAQDDRRGAIAEFDACERIRTQAVGAENPDIANCLYGLGLVALDEQADARAQGYFERAVTLLEKAAGPEHYALASPLTQLAKAHLYQHHGADAVALAERALAIALANQADARSVAETRFVLGQARWLVGPDKAAALAECKAARDALVAAGVTGADLEEFDAWLRHPRR